MLSEFETCSNHDFYAKMIWRRLVFGEELLRLMHFFGFFFVESGAEGAMQGLVGDESSIVAPPHKLWIGQRLVT